VLPLPYASTGSTVSMHGEQSSNGCFPSSFIRPLWGYAVSRVRTGDLYDLLGTALTENHKSTYPPDQNPTLPMYLISFLTEAYVAKRSNPVPQYRKGRQFELCLPSNPTGVDDKRGTTSVRSPLAVHAHSATSRSVGEGQHQPWDGRKARMGVAFLGRAILRLVGCGDHSMRFCGNRSDRFGR